MWRLFPYSSVLYYFLWAVFFKQFLREGGHFVFYLLCAEGCCVFCKFWIFQHHFETFGFPSGFGLSAWMQNGFWHRCTVEVRKGTHTHTHTHIYIYIYAYKRICILIYQTRPLTAVAAAGLVCPTSAKSAICIPAVNVDCLLHKSSFVKSSQDLYSSLCYRTTSLSVSILLRVILHVQKYLSASAFIREQMWKL